MTAPGNVRLARDRKIVGAEREALAKDLAKRYAEGESIREIAEGLAAR
jgi:helix-turn-helix protein